MSNTPINFHLNQFVKGASGCNCTGDGVFFIGIKDGVPFLTNFTGQNIGFPTSSYLKRYVKSFGAQGDGIYGFRSVGEQVMFENISNCPSIFNPSPLVTRFVYNTNFCTNLDDGFYGIRVSGCNSSYELILEDNACGVGNITGLTSNDYSCGDLILSWNDVPGAVEYQVTDGVNTYQTINSIITIPFSPGTKTFTVTPFTIGQSGGSQSITVNMLACVIKNISTNNYIHGDLTLSWSTDTPYTSYEVRYGGNTFTTTSQSYSIGFTTPGLVNYEIRAFDGVNYSARSSIQVMMMQSNVVGISNNSYSCGNLTLSRTPVVGATQYWISYGTVNEYVANTSITIPFTTSGSQTFTIRAGNANGFNTGGSIAVNLTSCGVSGLSSNNYTCGALNLTWNSVLGASSYRITWTGNSIDVTTTNYTIPFTGAGDVTYTVTARNGSTNISSASITVNRQICLNIIGSSYSFDGNNFYIITDNNPSDFYNNTSIFDNRSELNAVQGFSGNFRPSWVTQNPTTKKVHYGLPDGVYVGDPGVKSVSKIDGVIGKPAYGNNGRVYWMGRNSVSQLRLYNGFDQIRGNEGAQLFDPISLHTSPSGNYVAAIGSDSFRLHNEFGVLLSSITSFAFGSSQWRFTGLGTVWTPNETSVYVGMYVNGINVSNGSRIDIGSGGTSLSAMGGAPTGGSNAGQWIQSGNVAFGINGETILFDSIRRPEPTPWNILAYTNPLFESNTSNSPGTEPRPNKYNSLVMYNFSTGVTTNWFQSGLYRQILQAVPGRNLYMMYPVSIDGSTLDQGYFTLCVALGYSQGTTFVGPESYALVRVNNDFTYGGERTKAICTSTTVTYTRQSGSTTETASMTLPGIYSSGRTNTRIPSYGGRFKT